MQKRKVLQTKRILQGVSLVAMGSMLMGNQSCNGAASTRVMARKVAVGSVTAQPISLPAAYGSSFDFASVASSQMEAILPTTKYFSTANINQNADYSPTGLAADISNQFDVCTNTVPPNQTVTTVAANQVKTMVVPSVKAELGSNITMSYYGSCMIGLPQAVLQTAINDFSLTSTEGVTLSTTALSTLGGLNFSIQNYSLQTQMLAKSPLDAGNSTQVAVINNTYSSSGSLSLTLNLGVFSIGPSGYYQSPLSQITQSGLTKAVTDLATAWSAEDPWYATVLKACDTYIYINGSTDVGLQVGDVLEVKNVMYEWYGDVCASQWAGSVPDVTPVVYAQVVSLGDNIAAAQVIKGNSAYPVANTAIYPGARVYMYQQAATALKVAGLPMSTTTATTSSSSSSSSSSSTTTASTTAAVMKK